VLVGHRHDRIANAILYFTARTKQCTITKLMHLLYLLDFEHFAVTGRSVTESTYCALAAGPAPAELYWEFQVPHGSQSYLEALVRLQDGSNPDSVLLPLRGAVDDDFTARQICFMSKIAAEFGSDAGAELTARVCALGQPWDRVYRGGYGLFAAIPYELGLDELPNRERILELAQEHRQFRRTGSRSR
jgi:uncharacterized phage-associated protein